MGNDIPSSEGSVQPETPTTSSNDSDALDALIGGADTVSGTATSLPQLAPTLGTGQISNSLASSSDAPSTASSISSGPSAANILGLGANAGGAMGDDALSIPTTPSTDNSDNTVNANASNGSELSIDLGSSTGDFSSPVNNLPTVPTVPDTSSVQTPSTNGLPVSPATGPIGAGGIPDSSTLDSIISEDEPSTSSSLMGVPIVGSPADVTDTSAGDATGDNGEITVAGNGNENTSTAQSTSNGLSAPAIPAASLPINGIPPISIPSTDVPNAVTSVGSPSPDVPADQSSSGSTGAETLAGVSASTGAAMSLADNGIAAGQSSCSRFA